MRQTGQRTVIATLPTGVAFAVSPGADLLAIATGTGLPPGAPYRHVGSAHDDAREKTHGTGIGRRELAGL